MSAPKIKDDPDEGLAVAAEVVHHSSWPSHAHTWYSVARGGFAYDVHLFERIGESGCTVMVGYADRQDPPIRRYALVGSLEAVLTEAIGNYEADNDRGIADVSGRRGLIPECTR